MNTRSRLVIALGAGALVGLTGGAAQAAPSPAATHGKSTCERAVEIAKKKAPSARVTDVERDREHGRQVCQVELEKGRWEYEVHVALDNGKIVKFEREYDDD
ncbi:peptidase [Spongiactinospora gelatinilytica]|uniref:Peptidase n=1 Tax=Spongiactinospora gelatinilytica TaxID=2666298 RepID=A0A2W2GTU3_9ACTN|nr:PepSY domain-containing protein [Spongiactinospora gelatinilytica]PZG51342.1 peptidase [Spongiactinospora gelatinilytica]